MLDRLREKNPLPAGAMPVAAGLVVAGVANFGFLPIAYRSLSPDDYAALGVLWSLMFAVGNGVMQPVEQEVARAVVQHRADMADLGPAGVDHQQIDQIGVVEFVIGQRGQAGAIGEEGSAAQRVRRFLAGHARKPG